jgi:molybdopterin-guanine dinucleotide biosynthesis protein A
MYDMLKNCSGVILAGGENRRMPVLKALIEVDGQKIIERNINIMKRLFKQVFIVTNQPEVYVYLGIPLLGDAYDIRGPIIGVFTSLLNSSNQWVFISACDMPFINKNVIKYMYSQKNNFDAVVPIVKGKTEPLLAFYSKRLLPTMEKVILTDKRGIKDFLKNKRVKYVTSKEIKKIDPEAKSFANLNTPEDVNFYLLPQDRLKFKRKIKRR